MARLISLVASTFATVHNVFNNVTSISKIVGHRFSFFLHDLSFGKILLWWAWVPKARQIAIIMMLANTIKATRGMMIVSLGSPMGFQVGSRAKRTSSAIEWLRGRFPGVQGRIAATTDAKRDDEDECLRVASEIELAP
jgi:hypothetical protein